MTLDISQHKSIILGVLKNIYADSLLGPLLGFKGGTAAYLFYELDRFSVDLDFDLFDAAEEDAVFARIKDILLRYGRIKEAFIKKFTLFFLLDYSGRRDGDQLVKIEINRRAVRYAYSKKIYLGVAMNVMDQADMAANKLMAMRDRMGRANRDIFDVEFFLRKLWPVNTDLIEQQTGLSFKVFLKDCIDKLEKFDNQFILQGLGELLTEKQKVWVRARLREDTIFVLRMVLQFAEEKKV